MQKTIQPEAPLKNSEKEKDIRKQKQKNESECWKVVVDNNWDVCTDGRVERGFDECACEGVKFEWSNDSERVREGNTEFRETENRLKGKCKNVIKRDLGERSCEKKKRRKKRKSV